MSASASAVDNISLMLAVFPRWKNAVLVIFFHMLVKRKHRVKQDTEIFEPHILLDNKSKQSEMPANCVWCCFRWMIISSFFPVYGHIIMLLQYFNGVANCHSLHHCPVCAEIEVHVRVRVKLKLLGHFYLTPRCVWMAGAPSQLLIIIPASEGFLNT